MDRDSAVNKMNHRAATIQANIDDLNARFERLRTYQEAAEWDRDAEAVVRALEGFRGYITEKKAGFLQALETQQAERKNLPTLKRLGKDTEGGRLRKDIAGLEEGLASIDPAIEVVRTKADLTPTSPREQKALVAFLKTEKKELAIQKREITSNIRDAQSSHRRRVASVTGIRGSGVIGSVARLERVSARMERERSLAPLEDQRRILERQINDIDRRLAWFSAFSGSEPEVPEILYCGYCGRRATKGVPCSGCGSVQT